jgi:hypothetical protein
MMTLIAAAVVAAAQSAPAAPTNPHAVHAALAEKAKGEGCCCKDMAKGDAKVDDHRGHIEQHGDHADHGAAR